MNAALEQARAQVEEITALVAALEAADTNGREEAYEAIREHPLSVEIRSGWQTLGGALTAAEYRIVLCTGGSHVELFGGLGTYGRTDSVAVRYRSWSEAGAGGYFPTATGRAALRRYVSILLGE